MVTPKLRFAFLVQAEGRGHMTQAISLFDILTRNGHEVACAFIGKSKRRNIPDFFRENIKSPIIQVDSPNFITDSDNKSIKLFPSIIYNARLLGKYFESMKLIDQKIQEYKPDVLINFYDVLGGFYFSLFKPNVKYVAVGHQFLADHPDFPFAGERPTERRLFLTNNKITGLGAVKKLALSFRPYEPVRYKRTVVVPPLIRKEVKELMPETQDFILGYMVNDGYGDDIIKWHENNKAVKVECFWDRKQVPDEYRPHENIVFHQLSGEKFKEKMRTCKGYISTAGFESICEAMYLGKPALMIPVNGQYEQACNAIDAVKAGAGMDHDRFDVQKLIDFLPDYQPLGSWYKTWADSVEERLLEELTHF